MARAVAGKTIIRRFGVYRRFGAFSRKSRMLLTSGGRDNRPEIYGNRKKSTNREKKPGRDIFSLFDDRFVRYPTPSVAIRDKRGG